MESVTDKILKELSLKGIDKDTIRVCKEKFERLAIYEESRKLVNVTMTVEQHIQFYEWEKRQGEKIKEI